MAIDSYANLKTAVADWLDRTDLTSAIDDFLDLAEARIYRELRIRQMETALSVAISSGVAAVPADYEELRYAYVDGTPAAQLRIVSPEVLYREHPTRASTSKPTTIAREATNFIFGPYPDSDYTIKGIYYAKLAALSGSNTSNWLITDAPDLVLYGTLVHSAPYLADDARIALWEAGYQGAKQKIIAQDRQERFPRGMSMGARLA